MRTRLNQLLNDTKNEIVRLLVEIYKHNNNGLLPNWEDDEEIEISNNDIDNLTFYIDVDYEDVNCVLKEEVPITKIIITLDENLFFITIVDNEFNWTEVDVEDLIIIYEKIKKKYQEIFG
jgi:acid stress-induced BolA-like protein IbaG/YrbA